MGLVFFKAVNNAFGTLLKVGNYVLAEIGTWVFFKLKVFSNVKRDSNVPSNFVKNFTKSFNVVSAGIIHLVSFFDNSEGSTSTIDSGSF